MGMLLLEPNVGGSVPVVLHIVCARVYVDCDNFCLIMFDVSISSKLNGPTRLQLFLSTNCTSIAHCINFLLSGVDNGRIKMQLP